jgi:hypothetical protein
LAAVASALRQTHDYIARARTGLREEHLWRRLHPVVPSIGNLLLHLTGTEHQWIGDKIGRLPLKRDRDHEFSADGATGPALPDLIAAMDRVWSQSAEILGGLSEEAVTDEVLFNVHYTENHLAYHVGQMVMLRKLMESDFTLY